MILILDDEEPSKGELPGYSEIESFHVNKFLSFHRKFNSQFCHFKILPC